MGQSTGEKNEVCCGGYCNASISGRNVRIGSATARFPADP